MYVRKDFLFASLERVDWGVGGSEIMFWYVCAAMGKYRLCHESFFFFFSLTATVMVSGTNFCQMALGS